MKRNSVVVGALFCCLFSVILSSFAEDTVSSLLDSENWHDKRKAISIILKDIDEFKKDTSIEGKVLSALSYENERLKELRKNKMINPEPGRGEYYISLLDLVIRMDIPNSINLLIDNADLGMKVEDAIVKRMVENGKKDLQALKQMNENFFSEDAFYRSKRGSYLRINYKYIDKKQGGIDSKRKEIIRRFVKKGLSSENFVEKQYAILSSKYFDDDQEIVGKIRKISMEDKFMRIRDGNKTYPLREEADKIQKRWRKN